MHTKPGGIGICQGVKEDRRGEGSGFFSQPAEGQGGKENGKMPPTKDDQAMGKGEEQGGKKKGLAHQDAQEGESILKHLPEAAEEITSKEKLLGKGDEEKMKAEGVQNFSFENVFGGHGNVFQMEKMGLKVGSGRDHRWENDEAED